MMYLALALALLPTHDVTAYTHTGNPTASGRWPIAGITAACPKWIALGKWIEIERLGPRRCDDRIGWGTDFDLFVDTRSEALKWGRKHRRVVVR